MRHKPSQSTDLTVPAGELSIAIGLLLVQERQQSGQPFEFTFKKSSRIGANSRDAVRRNLGSSAGPSPLIQLDLRSPQAPRFTPDKEMIHALERPLTPVLVPPVSIVSMMIRTSTSKAAGRMCKIHNFVHTTTTKFPSVDKPVCQLT